MGKYRVLEPCKYQSGNKTIVHTRGSREDEIVSIDDAVAAKLGDKVQRLGGPPPEPEKPAEPKPEQGKRPEK